MKHLRQLMGLLAVVLGIIGMLACLAAIVGGWLWSFHLRESVDQVTEQVTTFTSRLSDRSGEASDWLAKSQGMIATLHTKVEASFEAALESKGIDPAELESIVRQVRAAIAEGREWLAVAESSGAFVEIIREVTEALGALVSSESRGVATEALAETMNGVRETGLALDELTTAIEQARSDGLGERGAAQQKVRSILSRSAAALTSLQGHTDTFGDAIDDVEGATLSLRSSLHQRLTLLLVIGTGLLIWQAVAQWSLARWGGGVVRIVTTADRTRHAPLADAD